MSAQPKERPVLFSAPMVRALLDGTKTQTRRAGKPVKHPDLGNTYALGALVLEREPQHVIERACPYGQPGDRLYVRETFGEVFDWCDHPEMPGAPTERWHIEWKYRADGEPDRPHLEGAWTGWKPSIHMPRVASRILLEVVSVRIERLQDISDQDAIAEGISRVGPGWERWHPDPADTEHTGSTQDPRLSYRGLWESINGAGSWDANPWVWVIEFKRVTP